MKPGQWITVREFADKVLADAVDGGYDHHVITAFKVDHANRLTIVHEEPPGLTPSSCGADPVAEGGAGL